MIEQITTLLKYRPYYSRESNKVLGNYYMNGSLRAFEDPRVSVLVSTKRCSVH